MKPSLQILALALLGIVFASISQAEIQLFRRSDYLIEIRSWEIENLSQNRRKITVMVSYEIPENTRFILHVSSERIESIASDTILAIATLVSVSKGETKIEWKDDGSRLNYYFGLWRGLPREQSPSGIECDGAYIDFTPKVTPTFTYPEIKN